MSTLQAPKWPESFSKFWFRW